MRKALLRDAAATAALYCIGLALASWASRPTLADADKPLPLFSIAAPEVDSLVYRAAKGTMTANRDPRVPERFLLRLEKPGAPPRDFVAAEPFHALLRSFTPFQALRAVTGPQPAADELAAFGLDLEQRETLTIQGKGDASRRVEVQVGKASYGTKTLFVREWRDGRILLAPDVLFQDLRRAEDRLVERRLFSLPFERARQLLVRGNGGALELFPQRSADGDARAWAAASAGQERTDLATTFVERLGRLRLMHLASASEEARLQSAPPASLLDFTLYGEDGGSETLRLVDDAGTIWAHGSFLRQWAKLSPNRALPLVDDFAALLGQEPHAPAPASPAP